MSTIAQRIWHTLNEQLVERILIYTCQLLIVLGDNTC